jgi:hypothetical protein
MSRQELFTWATAHRLHKATVKLIAREPHEASTCCNDHIVASIALGEIGINWLPGISGFIGAIGRNVL